MTATFAATSPACPRCGRALPADAPAGLCPRCLLSDGFGDRSEVDYTFRTDGRRFVPPTVEELASEFPNLEFVRLLGSGGMGAVYLAKQVRLDRPIAVKVLPPDLADDPAFAERFLREARALARLSHPNIVGVFDFGQTPGGLYYFLMEYIDGPTLRQVVAARSASPQQALEVVRQVCDALQYAHDKGIVHRDIKPENILLDAQGRPKIADFGLAKLLGLAEPHGSPAAGSLTHTKQAMGTPHYMAPEQIVGSRGVDHRADIYSLGVVFYELLTGELPLGRFAPPSKKVQIDVRLDEVVLRALEAEPAQRYQRASEVKTAVETISSKPEGGGLWFLPPAAPGPAVRFVKEATAGVGRAAATVLQPGGPGRVSRKAVVALLWLTAIPFAVLCFALAAANDRNDWIEIPLSFIGFLFAVASVGSIAGAPVLGSVATREIRASNGALTGLVAAQAAMLILPLLLLDLVIVWVACVFFVLIFDNDDPGFVIAALVVALPLSVAVDLRLIRAAWRSATVGLPAEVVERELAAIPWPVRVAGEAVLEWCDAAWVKVRGLFGARRARRVDVAAGGTASADLPRGLSAKAAVAAALVVAFVMGVVLLVMLENTHRSDPIFGVLILLTGAFAFPATLAPVAAPLLGWVAAREIRESGGRLHGLRLAVFAMLAFPLLLLDATIGFATAAVTALLGFLLDFRHAATFDVALGIAAAAAVGVALCVLVDVLIARAVWRRFRRAADADSGVRGAGVEARGKYRELWVGGAVLAVGLALFVFRVWRGVSGEAMAPATVATPVPTHWDVSATTAEGFTTGDAMSEPEDDPFRHWRRGPNGPELKHDWASMGMGVTPDIEQAINAAIQALSADYERLLDSHTTVAFDGELVKFKIEPFPEEIERLMNAFYERVDPLLSRDQQAVLRYNLPLRYRSGSGDALRGYENSLMPIGGEGPSGYRMASEVTVKRSGRWYRWHVALPDMSTEGDSPELPAWLRPWQERFEVLTSLRRQGAAIDPGRPPLVARKPVPALPGEVEAGAFPPGF